MKGEAQGIAWEDTGDPCAPPLLLVRPLGGNMALWGAFAEALACELRVVTFDGRGSGESPGPPRASMLSLADDARSVLDARGLRRAHVFGISLGSMVAARLALASPPYVASVVLASTAARGLAFEQAGLVRGVAFASCLSRNEREAERCVVRRVLSTEFRAEYPIETLRVGELAAKTPSPRMTIVAHALAAARHDVRAELHTIHVPTLVLAGDRDHLLGLDAGCDVARRIPGAQRIVIQGAGHDLTLERPHETAQLVLEFVRRAAPFLQPARA